VLRRIFGHKREEVAGGSGTEELLNLYASPNITYLNTYLLRGAGYYLES
jgi:hypothetical protein